MKLKRLIRATVSMAASMGISHAQAAPVVLESETLTASLDPAFPRISSYTLKSTGATLVGQPTEVSAAEINGAVEPCDVKFTRQGADTGEYQLVFPKSEIEVGLQVKVGEDAVELRVSSVKENGKTLLKTLSFPGLSLLTVAGSDVGAELAAVTATGYGISKETLGPVSDLPEMPKPDAGNYLFVSNGKVAAGIIGNHLQDVKRVAWQVRDEGGVKTASAWQPIWQYRELDSETMELPRTQIIITGDRNHDSKVDWQDAALVARKLLPKPLGAELVRLEVGDQIAMDFASLAQQPFLRILDEIKKSSLLTDNIGQRVLIKGYTAEGHDSANTDYGGHYNHRAGGLKDLTFLLEHAGKYNTLVGVHINATEVYPEANRYKREILDLDSNGNPKGGWAWLDASHLIDKRKDLLTGNLYKSLEQMRSELPKLGFVYLDVYGESGWNGWKIASKINSLGLPLASEYSTALDPWSNWSHNRALDGRIIRFIWNGDRELWQNDPLLRGGDHIGFMGWQGERSIPNYLRVVFGRNLPAKYLQNFELLSWVPDKEAIFSDGVKVVKIGDDVTVTRDDHVVMTWTGSGTNNRLFVPWDPKSQAKIYVWDEVGSELTRDLPVAWKDKSEVFLYRLTDLGRTSEIRLPVKDGKVTLMVEKSTAYVIYPDQAPKQDPMVWGEGGVVADPGFDSQKFTGWKAVPAEASEAVRFHVLETGDSCLQVSGPAKEPMGVSQMVEGLESGKTYSASVWVQVKGTRKAVIQVTPEGSQQSVHNYVSRTNVRNRNDSDSKLGTFFQRLRVEFTMPKGSTRANLQLLVAPDETGRTVEFDDVRVVEVGVSPESRNHTYYEDFENVDQGWGPFVYASPGQTQTHLSETNEGVTHDTVAGKYSFKTFNEPAGLVVRSLPSFLRLKPATRYKIALDYIAESDIYHIVVQGRAGASATRLDKALPKGSGKIEETFITGTTTETFLAVTKTDKGGGYCVLDNIAIDELGPVSADSVPDDADEQGIPGTQSSVEDFQKPLGREWNVIASKRPGTSVAASEGALVITAAANVSALAEHQLPAGTVAVETTVASDDNGDTWGPGLTLVWPGDKLVRINLRGGGNQFGVDATGVPQKITGSFQRKTNMGLRIRCEAEKVVVESCNEDEEEEWQSAAELPRSSFPGDPISVRLGKSHGVEATDDYADPGADGTSRFTNLRVYRR